MIECLSIPTSVGNFYGHYLQGTSGHLLVFIPGLMEPKAGLFYMWSMMAHHFHHRGHSCLLFDLAGQGDSLLPVSFDIWFEQRNAILHKFKKYKIHFFARGLGSVLLPNNQIHIAINPSLFVPVAEKFKQIRWKPSPFCIQSLTPAEPQALLDIEKECFHHLGAEAECIGGLQLPVTFVKELPLRLPIKLSTNILCYQESEGHPLFDKLLQRDALVSTIANDLAKVLHEFPNH